MKKNSTLQNKLKSYSAVAGAVAGGAIVNDANAQIIYTDVMPDVTVNTAGMGYPLDLDNNATVDIVIGYQDDTITIGTTPMGIDYVFAYGIGTNTIDTIAPYAYVTAHAFNDNISSTNFWYAGGVMGIALTGLPSGAGPWRGVTDKYLACKFDISGATHYGWARLDVNTACNSFTIKDYAYNSTANTAILAGDMGVTGLVDENVLTGVNAFAYHKQVNVNLGTVQNATMIIMDMTGKQVYNGQLTTSVSTIDMSAVSSGIYNIVISANGRTYNKKVSL